MNIYKFKEETKRNCFFPSPILYTEHEINIISRIYLGGKRWNTLVQRRRINIRYNGGRAIIEKWFQTVNESVRGRRVRKTSWSKVAALGG